MSFKLPTVEKHYEILELLFNMMPYVFWKDRDGRYQGGNLNQALSFGFSSPADFVGMTIFEIIKDQKAAKVIDETDNKVMTENISLVSEDIIAGPKGERTYLSQKSPICNDDGEVIGLLGFAMDITDIKQKEEAAKRQRDKLVNIAAQVAHDIKSPTASLLMLLKSCTDIPEKERINLREAAITIQDIANNLLNQYQHKAADVDHGQEEREHILASASILQLLAEKKLQYQDLPIQFDYEFSQHGSFAFIKMEPTAFKRLLSNIINNAVDAFEQKQGLVVLKLDADNEWVKVTIKDNGKGMPAALIKKIMNNIAVTSGKKEGHGIGLAQVREALQRNQGDLTIESQVGRGTQVVLTFPRSKAPSWIAEEITLNPDDIVIILDDDASIHGAWDARFELFLKHNPGIQVMHFREGNAALAHMNALSSAQKDRVFLLTDYELLKQSLNGLDVVVQGHIQRSILVTSHYANKAILERSAATGTKILPKQLAPEIPIKINDNAKHSSVDIKKVDVIIVDDDQNFAQLLMSFAFADQEVVHYADPRHFLQNISKYAKDTKIFLDNNFAAAAKIRGVELAQQLHDLGYTRLYLLSGDLFKKGEIPDFLTVVGKDNLDSIEPLAKFGN